MPNAAMQAETCGDRYNALLGKAKVALIVGDRIGAIRSLTAARTQLRRCAQEEEDSPSALALDDARGRQVTLTCDAISPALPDLYRL